MQSSKKWQKITRLKYWTILKQNYFQLACSIIIIFTLPKVSLIPSNFTFCNKCLSIFSHLGSILIIIMFFNVFILHQPFLLQKDQNWYQESWLGLIQNYEGSTTSPNFWSFFIKHFDLRFRCPAGVNESNINAAYNIQSKTLSWLLLDVIFAATSFNPPGIRDHEQTCVSMDFRAWTQGHQFVRWNATGGAHILQVHFGYFRK